MVDADPADLLATAAAQPHDAGFVPFVRRAQAAGIPVEVVSDGFGFFIEPALRGAGRAGAAGRHRPDDVRGPARGDRVPERAPALPRLRDVQARPRPGSTRRPAGAVVFIGDGESDRYAAGYSDVVFAKRSLVRICLEAGWPFQRWTEFSEIDAWLADTLEAWRGRSRRRCRRRRPHAVLLRPGGLGRGPRGPAARGVAAAWPAPLTRCASWTDDAASARSFASRAVAWIEPARPVSLDRGSAGRRLAGLQSGSSLIVVSTTR